MSAPGAERVVVVDRDNAPVGVAPRARVRAERLTHRATYVFVFSSSGELLIQRRTPTKDLYPGYLDAAAGGVVVEGESYEESAARELAEELGVTAQLERHFDLLYEDPSNSCWGRVFTCRHDGPFTLQAEEVESAAFHRVDDVLGGAISPVTPDTLAALRSLRARGML